MSNLLPVIIGGVAGAIASAIYYKKAERRKEKINLILQLFGNRHNLKGDRFTEALNNTFIVFYNSNNVIDKLNQFYKVTQNDEDNECALCNLFKALLKDVKLDKSNFEQKNLLIAFNNKQ